MIACLYPRPLLFPLIGGWARLTTGCGISTTSTSTFVAGCRSSVRILLSPKFYFVFFGAFDTSLTHLLVVLNLSIRELAVLPEYDVETKSEDTKTDEYQRCEKYLHNKSTNSVGSEFSRRNLYQIQFLS